MFKDISKYGEIIINGFIVWGNNIKLLHVFEEQKEVGSKRER